MIKKLIWISKKQFHSHHISLCRWYFSQTLVCWTLLINIYRINAESDWMNAVYLFKDKKSPRPDIFSLKIVKMLVPFISLLLSSVIKLNHQWLGECWAFDYKNSVLGNNSTYLHSNFLKFEINSSALLPYEYFILPALLLDEDRTTFYYYGQSGPNPFFMGKWILHACILLL